jgi:hypothetical protein
VARERPLRIASFDWPGKNLVFPDISANKLWRGQASLSLSVVDALDILDAVFAG